MKSVSEININLTAIQFQFISANDIQTDKHTIMLKIRVRKIKNHRVQIINVLIIYMVYRYLLIRSWKSPTY